MQALESLNDSQVNDFLSGKSPLNLSVRLGDHMMLIQLQLSTINPTAQTSTSSTSSSASSSTSSILSTSNSSTGTQTTPSPSTSTKSRHSSGSHHSSTSTSSKSSRHNHHSHHHHHHHAPVPPAPSNCINLGNTPTFNNSSESLSGGTPGGTSKGNSYETPPNCKKGGSSTGNPKTRSPTDNNVHNDLNSYLMKDVENLESIVKSLSNFMDEDNDSKQSLCVSDTESGFNSSSDPILEQSPIKSLSNLVSNSITPVVKPIPSASSSSSSSTPTTSSGIPSPMNCSDPISANLTSCLCKRLDSNSNGCDSHGCGSSPPVRSPENYASYETLSVPKYPVSASTNSTNDSVVKPSTSSAIIDDQFPLFLHKTANNPISKSRHSTLKKHHSTNSILSSFTSNDNSNSSLDSSNSTLPDNDEILEPITATMDNPALAEASRNLTQTLRKLSKKVFPRGDGSRRIASGAVIESMKHHGKGIYSGTFSGTLNPALQDKHGRPKRDISTIIHILNDLLSAAPQCARSGAKIYFEPTTSSSLTGSSLAATSSNSQSAPVSPIRNIHKNVSYSLLLV